VIIETPVKSIFGWWTDGRSSDFSPRTPRCMQIKFSGIQGHTGEKLWQHMSRKSTIL